MDFRDTFEVEDYIRNVRADYAKKYAVTHGWETMVVERMDRSYLLDLYSTLQNKDFKKIVGDNDEE